MKNTYLLNSLDTLPNLNSRTLVGLQRLVDADAIFNLLCHMPSNVVRRYLIEKPQKKEIGQLVTFVFHVKDHQPKTSKRSPYRIKGVCVESQEPIDLVFFNAYERFLRRVAPSGASIVVSGRLQFQPQNASQFQLSHPEHLGPLSSLQNWVGIEPMYPLTQGITQIMLRSCIAEAFKHVEEMTEWIAPHVIAEQDFPSWIEAIKEVHFPRSIFDISPLAQGRQRLAYDELFAKQLSQHYYYFQNKQQAISIQNQGLSSPLLEKLISSLPFALTHDQKNAINDIAFDMAQSKPMHRLIQGDVGSGKTLVALAAAMLALAEGGQAALLAPTDILARQHFATVEKFLKPLGISYCLLTGRDIGRKKARILRDIETGHVQLIIGTHAIFQKTVIYHKLVLAVIDEQHRFGVKQRLELSLKSENTHVLSMTATPIPRTLFLANFGEMDVSLIKEKPPGRKPVDTRTVNCERLYEVVEFIKTRLERKEKVFWVCPLVEESETLDFAAAKVRFESLRQVFGDKVVLAHGQLKGDEKEEGMRAFTEGDAQILVSTTVIEVGVDVPSATVMIIEHAERFGLAQLHQLRGRVGRGNLEGVCLLLFGPKVTHTAKKRLEMMKKTEDGFLLAEADLRLRGGGDPLGLRQSGLPKFLFAVFDSEDDNITRRFQELYEIANQDAIDLIHQDPMLESPRGQAGRMLMALFKTHESELFKKSG